MSDKYWLSALQLKSKDRISLRSRKNATQSSEHYLASSNEFLCQESSQRLNSYMRRREMELHDQSYSAHTKTLYTEYEESEEDLEQFIENTKSLKQKIYQKLASGKKSNRCHKQLINEATFRPQPLQDRLAALCNKQNQRGTVRHKCNTNRQEQKPELYALPWENRKPKNENDSQLLNMSFLERQQTMVKKKELNRNRRRDFQKQQQLQECTFSPKLTPYKVKGSD